MFSLHFEQSLFRDDAETVSGVPATTGQNLAAPFRDPAGQSLQAVLQLFQPAVNGLVTGIRKLLRRQLPDLLRQLTFQCRIRDFSVFHQVVNTETLFVVFHQPFFQKLLVGAMQCHIQPSATQRHVKTLPVDFLRRHNDGIGGPPLGFVGGRHPAVIDRRAVCRQFGQFPIGTVVIQHHHLSRIGGDFR